MIDRHAPLSASQRALDLLTGRLHEPWSVARLAGALGVSSRTLHRALRREIGTSPMALLRRARLAQARFELDAPEPGATVTTIALKCGFNHLGRFSIEYRRRFGERPSTTLRRAAGESLPEPAGAVAVRGWSEAGGAAGAASPLAVLMASRPALAGNG